MIDRTGGRRVLVATSLIFAGGLAGLGVAQGVTGLFAAWLILGIGMGAGLYEAAFATLVALYGNRSRGAITGITLIAGFASTVGWPLSTFMESHIGWRGACLAWAALHLNPSPRNTLNRSPVTMPELPVTTNRKPLGNSGHDKAESAVTMPESAVTFTGIRTRASKATSWVAWSSFGAINEDPALDLGFDYRRPCTGVCLGGEAAGEGRPAFAPNLGFPVRAPLPNSRHSWSSQVCVWQICGNRTDSREARNRGVSVS